jgi:hypothetical protein
MNPVGNRPSIGERVWNATVGVAEEGMRRIGMSEQAISQTVQRAGDGALLAAAAVAIVSPMLIANATHHGESLLSAGGTTALYAAAVAAVAGASSALVDTVSDSVRAFAYAQVRRDT